MQRHGAEALSGDLAWTLLQPPVLSEPGLSDAADHIWSPDQGLKDSALEDLNTNSLTVKFPQEPLVRSYLLKV